MNNVRFGLSGMKILAIGNDLKQRVLLDVLDEHIEVGILM
jgi:hypothetical protein